MYGWQAQSPENIPANLSYWLTKVNHLKLALSQQGLQPSVQLLGQKPVLFCEIEAALLGTNNGWLREIYLARGERRYSYGRTLIPEKTYQAFAREFDNLGDQAIGEIMLHNKTDVKRSQFEFGIILPGSLLFACAMTTSSLALLATPLWARRSYFYLANLPLLIIEIFLDIPVYEST